MVGLEIRCIPSAVLGATAQCTFDIYDEYTMKFLFH